MANENNGEAKMANYRNTILSLQIIFATATIVCGAANMYMNSQKIGFVYEEVQRQRFQRAIPDYDYIDPDTKSYKAGFLPAVYEATRMPHWRRRSNGFDDLEQPAEFRFPTTTVTDPPPTRPPTTMVAYRTQLVDKFCWDNSGLWGGVLVLLAVLLNVRRANKGFLAVFQSVSWVCGLLICLGAGVAATIWCNPVMNAMHDILDDYNRLVNPSEYERRSLYEEININLAYGIMAATVATAIFCYLNVALYTLQLLDGSLVYCFSRCKAIQANAAANPGMSSCFPCGAHCVLGGFVCKVGTFGEHKDGDEQKTMEYKPLIEEGSGDKVDAVTENGFVA